MKRFRFSVEQIVAMPGVQRVNKPPPVDPV